MSDLPIVAQAQGLFSLPTARFVWRLLTQLGDPTYVLLLTLGASQWCLNARTHSKSDIKRVGLSQTFPLVHALMTTCLIFCLGSNAGLKWPLRADRPYWLEFDHTPAQKSSQPRVSDPSAMLMQQQASLEQFHITCETGYGMPSGHVTASAAAYGTLALAAASGRSVSWKCFLFICWAGVVLTVAAGLRGRSPALPGILHKHLPQSPPNLYNSRSVNVQTVAGANCGATVIVLMSGVPKAAWSRWESLGGSKQLLAAWGGSLVACGLLMAKHVAIKATGVDPDASFAKAEAACRPLSLLL